MTHAEFEGLLVQALIRSAQETWIERPSEETLRGTFPDTKLLDEAIRRIQLAQMPPAPAAVTLRPHLYRRILHTAAMVLLSMSLLFGALMLHPEARQTVINMVVTWYEDHVKYSFQDKDAAALPQEWEFGYIPEGFTLLFEERLDGLCTFMYERSDGAMLNIFISNESGTQYADNEHYDINRMVIGGDIADVYEATEEQFPNMIVWYREQLGVLITVIGDIAIEEMTALLTKIKP